MKRILVLSLCFAIAFCLIGCNNSKKNVTKNTSSKAENDTISEKVSFKITDEKDNILLSNEDIKKVEIIDSENGKFIAFTTTVEGRLKLENATTSNMGKSLNLVVNDVIVSSPTVSEVLREGVFTISGYYDIEGLYDTLVGK